MDSSRTTSLITFLLQRIDQELACLLASSEVKHYPQELSALLSSQILQETAPAEEIICRLSCDYDCNFKVRRLNQKTLLICPRHQLAPKEISEDDVRQYRFNLSSFITALNQANGIKPAESSHKPLTMGLYQLGEMEADSERLTLCLALGLLHSPGCLFNLLSLRALIKEGRIAVLFPSRSIADQSHLCRLAAEQIYPLVLIDLLEDGSLRLSREKLVKLIRPQADAGEDTILIIDTKKRLVLYKGHSTTLPPLTFDMLLLLAKRTEEVIPRDEIYNSLWKYTPDGDVSTYIRQIDDHKRKILDSLSCFCSRKNGITKKEIKDLIVTHPKVGLQLNLHPSQVKIV